MRQREIVALLAVIPLFLVMAISFVGIPWPTEVHEIPVYDGNGTTGIANSLFGSYPLTVVLIGILLASSMIGGIYLAKMEREGVGP